MIALYFVIISFLYSMDDFFFKKKKIHIGLGANVDCRYYYSIYIYIISFLCVYDDEGGLIFVFMTLVLVSIMIHWFDICTYVYYVSNG